MPGSLGSCLASSFRRLRCESVPAPLAVDHCKSQPDPLDRFRAYPRPSVRSPLQIHACLAIARSAAADPSGYLPILCKFETGHTWSMMDHAGGRVGRTMTLPQAFVEKDWICQFRSTSPELSRDLLKTVREEVYSSL